MEAYLDNNATSPPDLQVIQAMLRMMERDWANPSSVHRLGQQARQQVELAREQVCHLLNCKTKELVFTSGATEASNLAIRGILAARPARRMLVTTDLDHSAVRAPGERVENEGLTVHRLGVNADGVIHPDELKSLLEERAADIGLVAVHWINNETGVIQPIEKLAALCREKNIPIFTDATQAVGKVVCDVQAMGVDALAFAGHKFHGPKGIGGLYVRGGTPLVPQTLGGPQERDRRAGTENTPGIVGLGQAAELARQFIQSGEAEKLREQRDRLEQGILKAVPDAVVNSAGANRLWNTSNIAFPHLQAEAILLLLSEKGVYCAAGAACSSGSLEPSPVLLAQGIPEPLAHGSVRFSLSRHTRPEEIDYALDVVPKAIARLRQSMR